MSEQWECPNCGDLENQRDKLYEDLHLVEGRIEDLEREKLELTRDLNRQMGEIQNAAIERINKLEFALKNAIEAYHAIAPMAEKYAEAGGMYGPEMRDYRRAEELIEKAEEIA